MSSDLCKTRQRREKALALTLDYFRDIGRDTLTAIPPHFLEMAALVDGFLSGEIALRYQLSHPPSSNNEEDTFEQPEGAFTFLRAVVDGEISEKEGILEERHTRALEALNRRWEEKEKAWLREGEESFTRALASYEKALKCERKRTEKQRQFYVVLVCLTLLMEIVVLLAFWGKGGW